MKKWIKPFVKVIVLDEEDIITSSSDDTPRGVYGRGFQNEGDNWIDKSGSNNSQD